MKKKFLVVALMAALSTIGYAAREVDQSALDEVKNQAIANAGAIDRVETELTGKVTEVENALAGKVDQSALDEVKNQAIANAGAIDELSGKVDGHAGRLDSLEGQMSETLGNIAGIDWDNKQQQEQLNKHEEALANKADKGEINDLHAKVEAVEKENERVNAEQDAAIAKGDRIDKVQNQQIGALQTENVEQNNKIEALDKNKVNKADQEKVDNAQDGKIQANTDKITALENNFAQYDGRLSGLEKKVDHLDDKMNKGLSLMAAMNAVDFQNVQTGEMALGAGIGHYGNAQSVALGVAYAPVEDLTVNAKYSITAGDPDSFAVGAGATYKFKVGR